MSARENPAIRRLLGPAAPELTCEACFEHVDRYVELELADSAVAAEAAVPGMAAHLDGCPACAEEHAVLRALLADGAEAQRGRSRSREGWTRFGSPGIFG